MFKYLLLAGIFSSFLHAGWLSDFFDSTPTPPFKVAVNLSKKGNVFETKISITEKRAYVLALHFLYVDPKKDGGSDIKRLQKFIGNPVAYDAHTGTEIRTGTPIPLRVSIVKWNTNKTSTLIMDKNYLTKGRDGSIVRHIDILPLEEGKYIVRLESLENVDELIGRETLFSVSKFWKK